MAILTINKRILDYLNKKGKGRIKPMCEDLEINRSSGHAIITRLKHEKLITRIEHGLYKLTEQGKIEADKIMNTQISRPKLEVNQSLTSHDKSLDLEDLESISKLKNKYGREELIRKLKRIIDILE